MILQVNCDPETGGMEIDSDFFVDFGKEPNGPSRAVTKPAIPVRRLHLGYLAVREYCYAVPALSRTTTIRALRPLSRGPGTMPGTAVTL